jgi:hypothetical protein
MHFHVELTLVLLVRTDADRTVASCVIKRLTPGGGASQAPSGLRILDVQVTGGLFNGTGCGKKKQAVSARAHMVWLPVFQLPTENLKFCRRPKRKLCFSDKFAFGTIGAGGIPCYCVGDPGHHLGPLPQAVGAKC